MSLTSDELVAYLKARGVPDDQAELYRDVRLKGTLGKQIVMPIVAGSCLIEVHVTLTGEDEGFIPVWNSVEEHDLAERAGDTQVEAQEP